jgi:hypothetical protein
LVLDVDGLLDEGRGNGVVDVGNSLGHTLTTPLGLVSITELASLVGAGRGTGGDDGTVQTGLGDNVNLNGWVALVSSVWVMACWRLQTYTRVVDGTGVDLGDSHDVVVAGGWAVSAARNVVGDQLQFEKAAGEGTSIYRCGLAL